MIKKEREPVSSELLTAMSNQLVEMPISPDKAAVHADILEAILKQTGSLRSLPIKEIEPVTIFSLPNNRKLHD